MRNGLKAQGDDINSGYVRYAVEGMKSTESTRATLFGDTLAIRSRRVHPVKFVPEKCVGPARGKRWQITLS
jgi:hypothetical protein